MSETAVSSTVAFLFGGMIFLLAFTRLGGLPTVLLALAILVVYLTVEAWHAWRTQRQARKHRLAVEDRWFGWVVLDALRYGRRPSTDD